MSVYAFFVAEPFIVGNLLGGVKIATLLEERRMTMTNYEKIKKMNLADIAVFLFDIQADAMLSCLKNSKKKYPFGFSDFVEWLESEVEEDG